MYIRLAAVSEVIRDHKNKAIEFLHMRRKETTNDICTTGEHDEDS